MKQFLSIDRLSSCELHPIMIDLACSIISQIYYGPVLRKEVSKWISEVIPCFCPVDLDEAISVYRQILEFQLRLHPHRYTVLDNLANLRLTRFKQLGQQIRQDFHPVPIDPARSIILLLHY
jgi:hypothetical protein